MKTLIIGIAGGTGSGKTTLAEKLARIFGNDVAIIKHDSYYKCQDGLSLADRAKQNYDHPNSFDTELMVEHIKKLKAGESIFCPVYDYSLHNRSDKTELIEPKRVIITEGIMILESPELRSLMDIRIFVDTDADVRIIRRIMRDVKERGRTLDSVVNQYLTTVKPMHERFIEPFKRVADIIVPEGGYNEPAFDIIVSTLVSKMGI